MRLIIYFLSFFLIGLSFWTYRFFGPVSIDQAIWTISFGAEGVLAADSVYIKRFFSFAILWPCIIALIFSFLEYKIFHTRKYRYSLFILATGIIYFSYQYNLLQYLRQTQTASQDYFLQNYTDANKIKFYAHQPKSLVLIYVESLEATYANPELFDHDLLKKLTQLQNNHLVFNAFRQVSGTGWTVGGIVSTQCGIPLKSMTIMGNNRVGENINYFLPKVKCLGDILAEQGYKNIFLGGSSLVLGGKGKFFSNHHYTEIYGYEDWLKQGYQQSEMNRWGLPDDELFKQAKIKINELMKDSKPFNLTLLTVDMHGVKGQLNKTCAARGYHDFSGIVECTADLVADFVNYMVQHGVLNRANIVITGDHLAMSNEVIEILQTNQSRTIFNVIISKEKFRKNSDEIVHFDLLPTILGTLGIHFDGEQLGLGQSAIGKKEIKTAQNRISMLEEGISYNSQFYNQLWLP